MSTQKIKNAFTKVTEKEYSNEAIEKAISGINADASNLTDSQVELAISGVEQFSDEKIEAAISR